MNLISTSWSCQRCGAAFISTPPEHGLCDQCLTDLEAARPAGTDRQPALPHLRRPGVRRLRQSPHHPRLPIEPQNSPSRDGEVSGDDG